MKRILMGLVLAGLLPSGGWAQQHHHMGMANGACSGPELACASSASPYFAPDGTFWLIWAAGGQVSVAHSADKGAHFSEPARVTPGPAHLDEGPDSRPQLVAGAAGRVTAAYAIFRDKNWNGQVMVSHSGDGGAHFDAPRPLTADSPSQRFQGMEIDSGGRVFAAWLDKRDVAPARARGEKYAGAALAFAWLDKDFAPARIAADNTCECCRLGLGFAGPGRPIVAFRNIFNDTVRDHAVIVFANPSTPGPLRRVSEDRWEIDGCPHQGPSLAVGSGGTIHVAWFSGGGVRTGLFHARSTDEGAHFSEPMGFGESGRQNSRPFLLVQNKTVFLVWKSFDGEQTEIRMIVSHDDGATWAPPRTVAATGDESDHPILVGDGTSVYLSWFTHREGYRLIALEPGS